MKCISREVLSTFRVENARWIFVQPFVSTYEVGLVRREMQFVLLFVVNNHRRDWIGSGKKIARHTETRLRLVRCPLRRRARHLLEPVLLGQTDLMWLEREKNEAELMARVNSLELDVRVC